MRRPARNLSASATDRCSCSSRINASFCSLNVRISASMSKNRSSAARTVSGFTGICPSGLAILSPGPETLELRCPTVTLLAVPGSETTVTSAYARAKSAQFVARRKDSMHRRYARFCSPGNREEDKTRKDLQRTARTTYNRKGTNGHVTMYIMYITVISHWDHPNVRIRVSIKLHLQDHLSIASSHCTALPIPSQHHSPRTTSGEPHATSWIFLVLHSYPALVSISPSVDLRVHCVVHLAQDRFPYKSSGRLRLGKAAKGVALVPSSETKCYAPPSSAASPSTLGSERREQANSPKKRLHHQQTE